MDYIKNWDDNLVLTHIGCEFNIIHNYFQQKNIKELNYKGVPFDDTSSAVFLYPNEQ